MPEDEYIRALQEACLSHGERRGGTATTPSSDAAVWSTLVGDEVRARATRIIAALAPDRRRALGNVRVGSLPFRQPNAATVLGPAGDPVVLVNEGLATWMCWATAAFSTMWELAYVPGAKALNLPPASFPLVQLGEDIALALLMHGTRSAWADLPLEVAGGPRDLSGLLSPETVQFTEAAVTSSLTLCLCHEIAHVVHLYEQGNCTIGSEDMVPGVESKPIVSSRADEAACDQIAAEVFLEYVSTLTGPERAQDMKNCFWLFWCHRFFELFLSSIVHDPEVYLRSHAPALARADTVRGAFSLAWSDAHRVASIRPLLYVEMLGRKLEHGPAISGAGMRREVGSWWYQTRLVEGPALVERAKLRRRQLEVALRRMKRTPVQPISQSGPMQPHPTKVEIGTLDERTASSFGGLLLHLDDFATELDKEPLANIPDRLGESLRDFQMMLGGTGVDPGARRRGWAGELRQLHLGDLRDYARYLIWLGRDDDSAEYVHGSLEMFIERLPSADGHGPRHPEVVDRLVGVLFEHLVSEVELERRGAGLALGNLLLCCRHRHFNAVAGAFLRDAHSVAARMSGRRGMEALRILLIASLCGLLAENPYAAPESRAHRRLQRLFRSVASRVVAGAPAPALADLVRFTKALGRVVNEGDREEALHILTGRVDV